MNRDHVFILSSWRAGSTLLQSLLNAHSQMVGHHEMHFPFIELPLEKRSWWRKERRRVLRFSRAALAAYGIRLPARELLHPDPVTNRATLEKITAIIRARHQKAIFVEKTPDYSLNAGQIDRLFPEGVARLFLVRSPGGVATSCHRIAPGLFPSVEAGLEHWLVYYSALEVYFRSVPESSFLRIRYEDLVAGDGALRDLCAFLQVPFEPAMLEYGSSGSRSALTGRGGFGDPSEKLKTGQVDTHNGERWREGTGEQAEQVAHWLAANPEAKRLAESLGYPMELPHLARSSTVVLNTVDFPSRER